MWYLIDGNGKVAAASGVKQEGYIYIAEPRSSAYDQPTFDGVPATENFVEWLRDDTAWFAAQSKAYEAAVQAHLDAVAGAHGYDNISTACEYAAAPNAFQAESQAFIAWRADVWQSAYVQLQAVEAAVAQGNDELPEIDAVIAALPVFNGGGA